MDIRAELTRMALGPRSTKLREVYYPAFLIALCIVEVWAAGYDRIPESCFLELVAFGLLDPHTTPGHSGIAEVETFVNKLRERDLALATSLEQPLEFVLMAVLVEFDSSVRG